MKGFFSSDQVKSDQIAKKTLSCASCGLYRFVLSPRMKPYGKFKKKVLLVGEAPGQTEDRRGRPWQGLVGRRLQKTLKQFGFDLFKDGLSTNACCCRPSKNRTPTPMEISCCRVRLLNVIKQYKPKVIILLGGTAITSVIGRSWKKKLGGVEKWRGFQIPDREYNAWLCPVYHPSFVERKEERFNGNLAEVIWKQDLQQALTCIDKPIKYKDESKYITYIESDKHFKSILPRLNKADIMSFDYEGTGLKPQRKGHQITNVAATISETECYSWMNNKYRALAFRKVLENPKVKKVAHNLQFENTWSKIILKADIKNWFWCTMLESHIIDNRPGVSGLKFQTYINFGVSDYDGLISPFLQQGKEESKQGANGFNNILEFFKKYDEYEALKYCGLDTIYGFMLFLIQYQKVYGKPF